MVCFCIAGSVVLALMVILGNGEAFFGPRGGGGNGGPEAAAPNPSTGTSAAKLTPAMMEEAARKVKHIVNPASNGSLKC